MSKPASNAHTPEQFVRIDMDKFLNNYTKMQEALAKIANPSPMKSAQLQALEARKIAKEALGL